MLKKFLNKNKEEEKIKTEAGDKSQSDSILMPKINPGEKKKSSGSRNGDDSEKSDSSPKDKKDRKKLKIFLAVSGVFLLVLIIIAAYVGMLFYRVYQDGLVVRAQAMELVASAQNQNLPEMKTNLQETKDSLAQFETSYQKVLWTKSIPYFGVYVSDGEHAMNAANYGIEAAEITIDTVEPYADIIGLSSGEQAESGEQTAQDRLEFVVSTIPDVIPKADQLVEKVKLIRQEIDYIDPSRYPREIRGMEIRSRISKGKELVDTGSELIEQGKPLLEQAPYLLGVDDERRYLILFQNDKELRPTGGFLTAYSIASVEKGKFEPVSSDDIYNLEENYNPVVEAAQPLVDYIKGPYILSRNYRLRDVNWNPDFAKSMELFFEEAEKVGIRNIDGIIAVDTQVVVNLLEVLGPIGVPGYGTYSTEILPVCNCPQVIYELESFADVEGPIVWDPVSGEIVFAPENIDNRKKIIGPLMNSILSNALGQPKEKISPLFQAGFKSLLEKHVLFYMFDEDVQEAVEAFGIAGRIKDYQGDYLHVNDANLGGRKSNLYVTQEVAQEISLADDGSVEKTVTITYRNPEKHDGWLNSVLPNWVRVYVPQGSELISVDGLEDREDPYEELGKTVFAGFFELRPLGVSKVTLKYRLPFKVQDDEYNMFIQKQPGKDAPLYSIELGNQREEFFLRTDEELEYKL